MLFRSYQAEERVVLGPDPYPYNFADNRLALAAMCDYSHEQGMVSTHFAPEDLFAPSTLDFPESRVHEGGRIKQDV